MQETYYAGELARLDWGFITPNVTGALIASLMIGVWLLPWAWKHLYWVSLIVFAVLGVCLIQTFSRGGYLALMVGIIPVLWWAKRPWPNFHRAFTGIAVVGLLAYGSAIGAWGRMERGMSLEDNSASNRLFIYREVPRMVVDRPNGWGIGNGSTAYSNFYQPLDYEAKLRHLVSTHFTYLVEWNLLGRLAYVIFWYSILFLFWPGTSCKWASAIFGCWLTLFIAGLFSHIAEKSLTAWLPVSIVTIISIIYLSINTTAKALLSKLRTYIRLGLLCGTVLLSLILFTELYSRANSLPVKVRNGNIHLGISESNNIKIWLLSGSPIPTIGEHYGKAIRRRIIENPDERWVVLSAFSPDIKEGSLVVLSGLTDLPLSELPSRLQEIVLVNPEENPRFVLDSSVIDVKYACSGVSFTAISEDGNGRPPPNEMAIIS